MIVMCVLEVYISCHICMKFRIIHKANSYNIGLIDTVHHCAVMRPIYYFIVSNAGFFSCERIRSTAQSFKHKI